MIATPRFRIWLRPDGIVQPVWEPATMIAFEDAIAVTEAVATLTGGRRSPLLVDIPGLTTMPRPAAVPPSLGPNTRRDSVDQQALTLERRLEDLLDTVEAFVSFRFNVRAPVGPDGDIVDAIAGGLNFLGEELEASFNEVERRVADRTAELATATQELSRRVLHDELTGLPNRALFREHLSHRMATEGRRQTGFAGMPGHELATHLRERYADLPVFLMSG